MTRSNDYKADMSATRLEDHEIEQLLSGSVSSPAGMTELEQFVAALSTDERPPRDVTFMASSLAAVARSSGRSRKAGFRRVAVVMSSAAMLIGLSGIAMAADGSAPGDALYGIDRALERVGIGDGGIDERIEEVEVLVARGEEDEALRLLSDIAADGTVPESAPGVSTATEIEPPANDVSPDPEAVDSADPAQENLENRATPQETGPDTPDEAPGRSSGNQGNADGSSGNGDAVGQDEDTQPPGQEEQPPGQEKTKENNGQGNTNGPDENDGSEGNGQGNAVGQDDDTQPPGQATEPPGQEEQPPGQEKTKENNGQGDTNPSGENNGQGNPNGPG